MYFCNRFKTSEHEASNNITDSWGAIFLSPTHSRAEPYTLPCSLFDPNRMGKPVSRAPKRPVVIDLVDHTLTVPSQVLGYTLTLENEDGEVYACYINGTSLEIPQEFKGPYNIAIFANGCMYKGTIFLVGK